MQKNEKIKVLCQLGSFFDSYCNNHAEIKDNKFEVHALTSSFGDDVRSGVMDKKVTWLEKWK